MLTQLEHLPTSGATINDEDSGMSLSPLDGLSEYPIEQTEFEYFESNLASDAYYDISPPQEMHDSLPPPPSLTPTSVTSSTFDATLCETIIPNSRDILQVTEESKAFQVELDAKAFQMELDSKAFQTDLDSKVFQADLDSKAFQADLDSKAFQTDLKPFDEALDSSSDFSNQLYNGDVDLTDVKVKFEVDPYDAFSTEVYDNSMTTADFNLGSLYDTFDPNLHTIEASDTKTTWDEGASKGKIGPLQRRALDSIFNVTEKPSRGLVLHIASELGLHHLTVKNFFSNGRRRLRRAAARLNDPERTRRENERRKEKRRLAARASAAITNGENNKNSSGHCNSVTGSKTSTPSLESPPPKETTFVSLERRALMEKLADKVQRSKAQRSLSSEIGLAQTVNTPPETITHHIPQNLIIQPVTDILSQASQDILSHSTQGLLTELPHDFLAEPTHDLNQSTTSLLNPNTDPWNFF